MKSQREEIKNKMKNPLKIKNKKIRQKDKTLKLKQLF
jgi:hypothetical protein